jgi:hypothetical protein
MKRDEFTRLRQMLAPDLWPRIEQELAEAGVEPSGKGPRRRIPQRGLALATALVVVAGTAIGLWAVTRNNSFRGPGPGRAPATVKPSPESVTVVAKEEYPLACTFRILSIVVQPGEPVRWEIVLDNRGDKTIHHGNRVFGLPFKIADSSGRVVYEAEREYAGMLGPGFDIGSDLAARKTKSIPGFSVPLRWPGPLKVFATCLGAEVVGPNEQAISFPALPSLPMLLAVPGPAPSAAEALDRALAETGGLFDACRPTPDGADVIGRIDPPDRHPGVPPLHARCSTKIDRGLGFDSVTLSSCRRRTRRTSPYPTTCPPSTLICCRATSGRSLCGVRGHDGRSPGGRAAAVGRDLGGERRRATQLRLRLRSERMASGKRLLGWIRGEPPLPIADALRLTLRLTPSSAFRVDLVFENQAANPSDKLCPSRRSRSPSRMSCWKTVDALGEGGTRSLSVGSQRGALVEDQDT